MQCAAHPHPFELNWTQKCQVQCGLRAIDVDIFGRAGSDHALISTLIPVPNFSILSEPRVSNDNLPDFLGRLAISLSSIFTGSPDLSDPDQVARHVTTIYNTITSTWDKFACPTKYSPKSKSWWTRDLAKAKKDLSISLADSTPPWQHKNVRRRLPPHIRYSPEFMNCNITINRHDDE